MAQQEHGIPTEEELRKLPRWACVAFAARCARIVHALPRVANSKTSKDDVGDIASLIHRVECSASICTTEPGFTLILEDAVRVARVSSLIARHCAKAAIYAFEAAEKAMDAMLYHEYDPPSEIDRGAADIADAEAAHQVANVLQSVSEAAYAAAYGKGDYAGYNPDLADPRVARVAYFAAAVNTATRRDYELVLKAAKEQEWTDDTPVAPEFFGPLWPDGPPPGWPVENANPIAEKPPKEQSPEPTGEGHDLVLTFQVPTGLSDDEVSQLSIELADQADSLHRILGGGGLKVRTLEITTSAYVPEGAPA